MKQKREEKVLGVKENTDTRKRDQEEEEVRKGNVQKSLGENIYLLRSDIAQQEEGEQR